MNGIKTTLQKVLQFFLTKIVTGIIVIIGLVALIEGPGRSVLERLPYGPAARDMIIAVVEVVVVVAGYVVLFRLYEDRRITELSMARFTGNAVVGTIAGVLLQALIIAVIYLTGTYTVVAVHPVSVLAASFAFALTAGFVAEILFVGIVFRLVEAQWGTVITFIIFVVVFAILHISSKGATVLSVCATAVQAGFMLPAAFVAGRSLWLPIFLHFGWDFAEPGIFGGINPSTSIRDSLFTAKITGAPMITGGQNGPQDSFQSLVLCLLTGIILLWIAKRRQHIKEPAWKIVR